MYVVVLRSLLTLKSNKYCFNNKRSYNGEERRMENCLTVCLVFMYTILESSVEHKIKNILTLSLIL